MATKTINARLRAAQAVLDYLNQNALITAIIPALASLIASLNTAINQVIATDNLLTVGHKQLTADKNTLKNQLAKLTSDIFKVCQLYRKQASLPLLDMKMTVNYGNLSKLKDNTFVEKITAITDTANADIAELTPFGITNAQILTLTSQIPVFEAKCNEVKIAIANNKTLNKLLKSHISNVYIILAQIDILVQILRSTNLQFVETYFNTRIIHEEATAVVNGSINGKVVDSLSQVPLTNTKVTIIELNKTTKTNKLGLFEFKNIISGNYTIKTENNLFLPKEIANIIVQHNKISHLTITLSKGITDQHFGLPIILQTTGSATINKSIGTYNPNNLFLLKNKSPISNIIVWGSKIANDETVTIKIHIPPNQETIILAQNLGETDWTFLNLKSLEAAQTATLSIQKSSTPADQLLPLLLP